MDTVVSPRPQPASVSEKRLGPYRFLSVLGRGASSTVVECVDERSGGHVALKVPLPDRAASPEDRESIEREAARAATISHPHVVKVHGAVRDRGTVALVLDLVRGVPLSTLLEGGPLPADLVARIGGQIASALHAIHHSVDPASGAPLGLVHGDVSPQNVLVDAQGWARLSDFGLARRRLVSAMTGSGLVRGTPGYVAPEVVRGRPPSPLADQFALGALLHRALAGAPPFGEGDVLEVMRATVENEAPRLEDPLGPVVARAMAKRPARRYSNAGELADALAPHEEEGSGEALGDRVARAMARAAAW